ncbi:hypothetical protein ETB97_005471 [Aspergillus alliaceus]|uniref:Jacalin-type lectin domain-containing protein n=1 Tax=Petromyces alliaceus TaxID=209559 RepID=A0A8H5ZZ07_PETAA|nr:hypothetical protein ETB97_005471 [Aspergillus burnettii]
MTAQTSLYFGDMIGGSTGTHHDLWDTNNNKPLTDLDLWYSEVTLQGKIYTILRGITVRWGTGPNDQKSAGHVTTYEAEPRTLRSSYNFATGEYIDWMDVYGANNGRADSLRFKASHFFAAGGSGGDKGVQLKDGKRRVLVGFRVRAGSDIDALGGVFV